MGRVLGVDYGDVRIGIALSDETAFLASSLCYVKNTGAKKAATEVAELAARENAAQICVGLPINLDGSEGVAVEKVREFIKHLEGKTELPIETWDERFTTVTAQQALIEGDVSRKKRKEVVDKLAAQIMLQNYLDAKSML